MESFADYKYFKDESVCPFDDYDRAYIWGVEKEAFQKGLSFEERKEFMNEYIEHTKDHIGIIVGYPYEK